MAWRMSPLSVRSLRRQLEASRVEIQAREARYPIRERLAGWEGFVEPGVSGRAPGWT
jgi:hypothetical protein